MFRYETQERDTNVSIEADAKVGVVHKTMLYITGTVKPTCWHKPSPLDTNHITINTLQSHSLYLAKNLTQQKQSPSDKATEL